VPVAVNTLLTADTTLLQHSRAGAIVSAARRCRWRWRRVPWSRVMSRQASCLPVPWPSQRCSKPYAAGATRGHRPRQAASIVLVGSTSRPKGAVHACRLLDGRAVWHAVLDLTEATRSSAAKLFFAYGLGSA
jgi:hypothetical protein